MLWSDGDGCTIVDLMMFIILIQNKCMVSSFNQFSERRAIKYVYGLKRLKRMTYIFVCHKKLFIKYFIKFI